MAQLKSSIVTGSLRVTDAVLTDTVQTSTVKAPTTSGGSTYGAGTSGQVLKTNGTTAYWGDDTSVSPSSTTPLMDGTAAVGTGTTYARADHRHPTDTSRAPLASPALTGTPTAPTATAGTNTTQIATTAFVKTAVDNKSVPSATTTTPKMDGTAAVGSETTWAKGDHVHPTDTSRAPLASPALTGTPTAPTANYGTNTTQIATTAFVDSASKNGSVEYIVGTQTAATASWTGVTKESELYTGKTIAYKLPFASASGAVTLNLTLADGETTTGAKTVYMNNNTNVGISYAVNSVVHMTYDGTNWRIADYYVSNSDTQAYLIRYGQVAYKAHSVLYRYQLLFTYDETSLLPVNSVSNSKATTKALTTESFDPFGQVYYYNTTGTVNANANISSAYLWEVRHDVPLSYSFNTGTTLTAGKAVYLVCVPQSDGRVKLHTSPIAQDLPSTEDGLIYKRLGTAYNTESIQMFDDKPCYYYKDGAIRIWTNPTTVIETKASVPSTESSPLIKVGSGYYLWK